MNELGVESPGLARNRLAILEQYQDRIRELEAERDAALKRTDAVACCEFCERYDDPAAEPPGFVVCPYCWQQKIDQHVAAIRELEAERDRLAAANAKMRKALEETVETYECLTCKGAPNENSRRPFTFGMMVVDGWYSALASAKEP